MAESSSRGSYMKRVVLKTITEPLGRSVNANLGLDKEKRNALSYNRLTAMAICLLVESEDTVIGSFTAD